jgi:hypothetical protein
MKREDGRTAMTTSTKVAALALTASAGAALLLSLGACESVPLTAAPGSSMTLIANPPFVIANGGTSVVTAILVEPAGTFVPDGTVVFFFTDLGRVDPSEAKTKNGVARVTFVADSRSGQATITAISGGPAPAPTASSGTGTGTTAAAATAAGTNSATTPITIGGALPARLVVAADPARITSPRAAAIVATVYDKYGNPVQNVPVHFAITAVTGGTGTIEETLDSGGAPRYTDSNGQAFDTLYTRSLPGSAQKAVTVTATAPNDLSTDVKVFVN